MLWGVWVWAFLAGVLTGDLVAGGPRVLTHPVLVTEKVAVLRLGRCWIPVVWGVSVEFRAPGFVGWGCAPAPVIAFFPFLSLSFSPPGSAAFVPGVADFGGPGLVVWLCRFPLLIQPLRIGTATARR